MYAALNETFSAVFLTINLLVMLMALISDMVWKDGSIILPCEIEVS